MDEMIRIIIEFPNRHIAYIDAPDAVGIWEGIDGYDKLNHTNLWDLLDDSKDFIEIDNGAYNVPPMSEEDYQSLVERARAIA